MPERRRRRRASILVAATGAALAAGCAHPPVPKYVAATTGPRAELVMRGQAQPGETFGVYLFQDPHACTGLQQVGVGVANRDPQTTTIRAGLSTAEVFWTKPNRSVCRVRWSFEPVAGHKYLVATTSTPTGCNARILDATDPHNLVLEPSLRRRDVAGRLCVPMAQTTTVADAELRARASSDSDLPIGAAPRAAKEGAPRVSDDDLSGLKGN